MDQTLITQLGDELYDALTQCKTLTPLTSRHPDITIEDGYHIQERLIARRIAAGEKVVGKKIGVTSKAVMNMLGVGQPDFGWQPRKTASAAGRGTVAPCVRSICGDCRQCPLTAGVRWLRNPRPAWGRWRIGRLPVRKT
jgi:2-keto-4-pentenoate hydratase